MTPDPDWHSLAGLYALDALDDVTRAGFEAHLAGCEQCAEEVLGFGETAARLGVAGAAAAPEAMKQRVLTQVAHTRQASPLLAGRTRRRSTTEIRWLAVAAASLLVAAASLGTLAFQWHSESQRVTALQAQIARVMSDPARTLVDAPFADGGTATVVTSGDSVVVFGRGVPATPEGKTLQLWLINDAHVRSAGFAQQLPDGTLAAVVRGWHGNKKLGVTVEPAGGSAQPTTVPVLLVNMPLS